ncbi:MAG TPA: transporter [Blastocatellia bacterium]|nr:transporter [Blastocatellia bacterium]
MPDLLLSVLKYALLPVAATVTGATLASFRPPGPLLRSYIQHFAAGVVFSVVAVELLPDVVRGHAPLQVVSGFALGVAVMLGVRSFTAKAEKKSGRAESKWPVAMLAAVGVDVLVDGFLIGIGFAAGAKEGKLLTLALTIELLSLGLAVCSTLGKGGAARGQAILTTSLLGMLIVVGATLGATLLSAVSEKTLEVVLSFGLAALLFLVTEELLVEAHEEPETPLTTATFFAGFLLFLVLGMQA